MKLPIWYKAKNGKWVTLQHFLDGSIGLTMERAVELGLNEGSGMGMGLLEDDFFFDGSNRFLIIREPCTNPTQAFEAHRRRQWEQGQ